MATPDGKAAGGKEIDLYKEKPGLLARVGAGLKLMVGVLPDDAWFGPGRRVDPIAPPEEKGRQFDYPFAVNVPYTPRGEQGENAIDFQTLRRMADPMLGGLDLLRLAIETRKDQMAGQRWSIRERGNIGDGGDRARAIESALRRPDGVNTYRVWQRMVLEDLLVIDAPSVYVNRTKGTPKLPAAPKVDADGNLLPDEQQQGGQAPGGGNSEGGKAPPFGQKALPPGEGGDKKAPPFGAKKKPDGTDDGGDDARAEGDRQGDRQAKPQAGSRQGWGEDSAQSKDPRREAEGKDGEKPQAAFGHHSEREDLNREEGEGEEPGQDQQAADENADSDARSASQDDAAGEEGSEYREEASDAQGAAPEGEESEGDDRGAAPGAEAKPKPQIGPDGKPVLGPDGKPLMEGMGPDGKPKIASKLKPKKRLPTVTADDVGVLLEPIDGATLKRLVTPAGRTPRPPEPAYLQAMKGMPAFEYAADEIVYAPRNMRTNRIYGYSPVEQVITTINIALRRQLSQLEFYTAGTIPDMMLGVPETWTPEQIAQFQGWWDSLLAGNTAQRRQARFIPGGVNPIPLKDPKVKDEWDEWLARVVCFAFSISPQALVAQMNRATAETAEEQALNEGLEPLKLWWKDLMDTILAVAFKAPDLEFAYEDEEISDATTKINVWSKLVQTKIAMPNEAREAYGMEPIDGLDDAAMAPPAPPGMPGSPGFAPGGDAGDLDPNAPPGADPTSPPKPGFPPKPGGGKVPPALAAFAGKQPPPPPPNGARKPNPFAKGDEGGKPQVDFSAKSMSATDLAAFFEIHGDALAEFITKAKGGEGRDGGRKRLAPLARVHSDEHSSKLQRAFDRHFNTALAKVLAAVGAKLGRAEKADGSRTLSEDDLKKIEDALSSGDADEVRAAVESMLASIAADSGEMATQQIQGALTMGTFSYGDALKQVNTEAKAWAEDYAGDLITNINQTTLDVVRDLVTDAIENGDTVDDLADELMANAAFGAARSEMIARTELAFANVAGNIIGWKATGEVEGKEWIIAQDEYCDICAGMDGKVVPLNEPFDFDGEPVDGPPGHPNCRCDVVAVLGKADWDEEYAPDESPNAAPHEMAEGEDDVEQMAKGWIGVDLDGTLAANTGWKGADHIGEPVPKMVERVKEWVASGKDVRVFTARANGASEDDLARIQAWLKEHLGFSMRVTHEKDHEMIELWDDRAVQVVGNTGERADGSTEKAEQPRDELGRWASTDAWGASDTGGKRNPTDRVWNYPEWSDQHSETHAYRGVTSEEMASIEATGEIRSTMAHSHISEGTNYATDAGSALSYVQVGRDNPGRTGKPVYVIEARRQGHMAVGRDGYLKTPEGVPVSEVTRVWRFNPDGTVHEAKGISRVLKREYLRDQGGRFAETDSEGVIAANTLAAGGKDIPRAEMPQIKGKHWPEFKAYLERKGISARKATVPVAMLKPTQKEIHSSKVKEMLGRDEDDIRDKRILVSKDGYIVDGHHHWAALLALDKGGDAKVRILDAPIDRILALAAKFPKVRYEAAEMLADAVDAIFKNAWYQYVPRDEKGNWVTVGRAVNADTEADHRFAAKYHEAKSKFFADKGKMELAELHLQAAAAHSDAAERASQGLPYKSLNEAARAKTSEAEAASKGAHKGTFMTKAQAAEKADSEEAHQRAAQYHSNLRDKAAANEDFALADKHQAAADAHREAAKALAKGSTVDDETAKLRSKAANLASKTANVEQKTRDKGGDAFGVGDKVKTPQGEFQFAPQGPTKWGDHEVSGAYGLTAVAAKIANAPHENPESTYHQPYHNQVVSQFAAFRKALPEAERRAIDEYQGSAHGAMNRTLRLDDPDKVGEYTLLNIENMTRGLARAGELPMPKIGGVEQAELLTWRGMSMSHLKGAKPGSIVTDDGFTSMSTSYDSAKDGFAGDVMLKIHVPKGTRGIYMAGKSGGYTSQYEHEVMVQRGAQFEVMAIHRSQGSKVAVVEVRYLGSKPKKVDEAALRAKYREKHGFDPTWISATKSTK